MSLKDRAMPTGWEELISLRYVLCMTSNKGPFKYYDSKEVGGWGQKMAIFADLQYYLC